MAQLPGIEDTPYLQKEAQKFTLPGGRHPNDVRNIAQAPNGDIWLATGYGLYQWRDTYFERLPDEWLGTYDTKQFTLDDQHQLWVATLFTIAQQNPKDQTWRIVFDSKWDTDLGALMTLAVHQDHIVVATSEKGLGLIANNTFSPVSNLYPKDARIFKLQFESANHLWILGEQGAVLADLQSEKKLNHILPHTQVRALTQAHNKYFLATADGLYRVNDVTSDPELLTTPVRDLHDLTLAPNGSLFVASGKGVFLQHTQGTSYFHGPRWLPHNDTRAVFCTDEYTTLVATASGVSKLIHKPYTLAEKATAFEQRIRDHHIRLTGFVNNTNLSKPGDLSTSVPRPSDNDGLWTALYLAAQSYRYSVTGDNEAQQFAQQAFHAMEWLESITTVSGYPTKAIVSAEEDMSKSSVPWYPSADGKWLWKGDCSSDEIDGHMYGYTIYYDLAADASEKERIRTLVRKIIDHILDHGYFIVGPDGERTRWGVWAPAYLNGPWRAQRGLNSLEILAHLRTAHHITGEQRYEDAYWDLINTHGYAENVRRQKLNLPHHINHSDDELAFISYYPLLKYETDANLREIYLDSLEHAYQIERPERNPWWNFIYGALTHGLCDAEKGIQTLREIPMDLINWPIENSHRLDISFDAVRGRFGELQTVDVLPYDELAISKWNGNPYRADSPTNGTNEDDGTYYLLPYWMGRYYGFIK